jgi:hypothetical protein
MFFALVTQNISSNSSSLPQVYDTLILIIIVLLLVIRRSLRSVRGRKFSKRRIIQRPAVLIALSVVLLVFPVFYQSDILYFVLSLVAGIVAGTRLGTLSNVYMNEGILFYRSSILLTAIWAVTYVTRLILEVFFNITSFLVDTIFIILLTFSSGLFLGEAINLLEKYKEVKVTQDQQGQDMLNKLE